MDNATRGLIEWLLDQGLKIKDVAKEVLWVEDEIPLQSRRDLVLGYMLGLFDGAARLRVMERTKKAKSKKKM